MAVSFVKAMKDFFGDHPTNPSIKFVQELKDLSMKDRQDFRDMLEGQGLELVPPTT